MEELQPSKLEVASSNLVSRSILKMGGPEALQSGEYGSEKAHVAQSVERILGKDEVHRFNSDRGLQLMYVQT